MKKKKSGITITEKDITELIPYEKNPRINDESVKLVANSIKSFGFKVPIVIDKNNVIITGHTRLKAAYQLGLQTVPCIMADDLTKEEVKAFRLADNKVSEASEWDYDLLNEEIENIFDFDMGDFGFEFEYEDPEESKRETQKRVEDILNLGKGSYIGSGKYDIPQLKPIFELPEITEWIGFNYVMSDDNPNGKAVHFFVDDYQFERVWNNPDKYVEYLKRYAAVATPDFSPYGDMPMATQIYNHYRKHWIGCYLQERGINVVPTIRSSTDPRSLEWYLDGEPQGGIVLISSMWAGKSKDLKQAFLTEYNTMFESLNPCKVLVYGKAVDNLKGNIEYIDTFTTKRWSK